RQILALEHRPKIIFLTMHPEPAYAIAALEAGASGYVLKSAASDELPTAIRTALKGRVYVARAVSKAVDRAREVRPAERGSGIEGLTNRQREVLQLLAEGKQVKQVAAIMKLSPKTVEFHKYRIMELLGAHSLAELARYAAKFGMVS
ncbi:MAG TPA: response regulator transcription factor, partial [Candidatus Binataceae bacterium]|nr:response regulator transcription factor [Candidatus Binataceae bacterium]